MVYKNDGKYINTKDLLTAYKVVTEIMSARTKVHC